MKKSIEAVFPITKEVCTKPLQWFRTELGDIDPNTKICFDLSQTAIVVTSNSHNALEGIKSILEKKMIIAS